jgi:methionine--tRNA ligase beta chain
MMQEINPKDFEKLNIRVGAIKAAKQHEKLPDYILLIDLGQAEQDMQIVADLKDSYAMEELVGKQVVFVENVKSEMVGDVESQGLLLIAHKDDKPVLISPEKETLPGVQIYGIQDGAFKHHLKPEED